MRKIIHFLPAVGLTLAWITPVHFMPWVTWHSEVPVFGAVFLTCAWLLVDAIFKGGIRTRIEVPTMVFAVVALGLLACVQAAFGLVRYFGDAWTVLLYATLCAAAFLLGRTPSSTQQQSDAAVALAVTLLAAGLGCTLIALVQALDVWTASEWIARTPTLRRSGSNLAQPNQMATVVLMAAVSLAYLYERFLVSRALAVLLGVLLAAGLATTESRTGVVSLLVLTGWWFCRGHASRLRTRDTAIALIIALSAYAAWPPFVEFMGGQGDRNQIAHVNTEVGLRTIVWPQLIAAAAHRPWLGWGVRQTSTALTSVAGEYGVSEPYTYAHNIVLELLLGFGAPIALLLLALAAVWTFRRIGARGDPLGWYCMALWAPLSVHALLEFPYSYAYLLAPGMFALGLLDARFGRPSPRAVPATILAGALGCAIAVAAWSVIEYVQVEEDFRVARFESSHIGSTPPEYRRPKLHLLTQFDAMVEAARIVPAPGMTSERVTFAGEVAARFPWPALQDRYALSLALNEQPAAAERELRVIRAMHGELLFRSIRQNWQALAHDKYPQLSSIRMPD